MLGLVSCWMRRRRRGILLLAAVLVLAGCGGSRFSNELVERSAVTVEYRSSDWTLAFRPDDPVIGSDGRASNTVTFTIGTDDFIQHVSVYDRYVIEGSELVPADGAVVHDFSLSDEGPLEGSFEVDIGGLRDGAHSASLALDVSLEPKPIWADNLEPREATTEIALVYHVWDEPVDWSPGFPTIDEVQEADIEDREDLSKLLKCRGEGTFHHANVNTAAAALSLAQSFVAESTNMKRHREFVEAVPVPMDDPEVDRVWAIVDSAGHVVGTVERGQTIFICENKLPT